MIDFLPPELAWPAALVAIVWWLAVEFRHASPDPNPDELTALDVLERTGVYPRGGAL